MKNTKACLQQMAWSHENEKVRTYGSSWSQELARVLMHSCPLSRWTKQSVAVLALFWVWRSTNIHSLNDEYMKGNITYWQMWAGRRLQRGQQRAFPTRNVMLTTNNIKQNNPERYYILLSSRWHPQLDNKEILPEFIQLKVCVRLRVGESMNAICARPQYNSGSEDEQCVSGLGSGNNKSFEKSEHGKPPEEHEDDEVEQLRTMRKVRRARERSESREGKRERELRRKQEESTNSNQPNPIHEGTGKARTKVFEKWGTNVLIPILR